MINEFEVQYYNQRNVPEKVIVLGVYRQHSDDIEKFFEHLSKCIIDNRAKKAKTLITGDLNITIDNAKFVNFMTTNSLKNLSTKMI